MGPYRSMRLRSGVTAPCLPAIALAATTVACAHAHLAEAPLAARSVDPDQQPRLDARAMAEASTQFLHRGHIANGVFSSDGLGLTVQIQEDTAARVPPAGPELELRRRGYYGRHFMAALGGGVYFLFEPLTTELEARTTEALARGAQPDAKGSIRVQGPYAITLSVGVADVDEAELEDAGGMKVAFVPACGGATTLVLEGAWEGPQGDAATEQWFDRVRLAQDAPACAYVAAQAAR